MQKGGRRECPFDGRETCFDYGAWNYQGSVRRILGEAATDRETMEAEFDSSGDALFNYGYGCCVFTHNICGSKPQIPDGMPDPSVPLTPKFFANLRCPPGTSAAAPALNSVAFSREDHSENSPVTAEEEITLPMNLPVE